MLLDNNKEDKNEWIKNEKHIKMVIIGILFACICLIVVIVFFREQIWVIITNVALIVGLVGDLINILSTRKKG